MYYGPYIARGKLMRKTILVILTAFVLLLSNNTALSQPVDLQAQQQKVDNIKQTHQGKEIFKLVDKYSKQYKVDSNVVKAIILVESAYNPKATSTQGCKGLMQMADVSFYARKVGQDPYNIEQNIHAGTKHYAGMLAKYKGNSHLALAAYNAGGGAVDSSLRTSGTIPHYTKGYVNKVQSYSKLITF